MGESSYKRALYFSRNLSPIPLASSALLCHVILHKLTKMPPSRLSRKKSFFILLLGTCGRNSFNASFHKFVALSFFPNIEKNEANFTFKIMDVLYFPIYLLFHPRNLIAARILHEKLVRNTTYLMKKYHRKLFFLSNHYIFSTYLHQALLYSNEIQQTKR